MIVVTKTRCTILFSAAPTEFPKFGHILTESIYCGPQGHVVVMRMIISRSLTPLNSSKTCGAFADLRMVGRRRQLAPEDAECPWRQLRGASRSPRSGPPPLANGQARAVARLAEALRAKAATLKQELHAEPRLARALIIAGHQEGRLQPERPARERRGGDDRRAGH